MATNSGPSEESWDHYKNSIVDLYLERGMRLGNVIETMAQDHGFIATKFQYEVQLKKWKIRKYLSRNEWLALVSILGKRNSEGKTSNVYLNGKLVPKSKIRKEQLRYRIRTSHLDADNENLRYRIPEGIEIKSGTRALIGPEQSREYETEDGQWTSTAFQTSLLQGSATPGNNLRTATLGLMEDTSQYIDASVAPFIVMDQPLDLVEQKQIINAVPEEEEIPILTTAEETLQNTISPFTKGLVDRCWTTAQARQSAFSRMISKGKENLQLHGRALLPNHGISFSFTNVLRVAILNHWAGFGKMFIAHSLECVPLNELLQFDRPSLISEGLFDNLVRLSIEMGGVSMIKELNRLFNRGLNPDTFVCVDEGQWYTPLERASTLLHVELVEALLGVKADANQTYNGGGPLSCVLNSILYNPSTNNKSRKARKIVELLVKAGSDITYTIFKDAVLLGDGEILASLLNGDINTLYLIEKEKYGRKYSWDCSNWGPVLCRSKDELSILAVFKNIEKRCTLKHQHDSRIKLEVLQHLLSSAISCGLEGLRGACMQSGAQYRAIDLQLALMYGRTDIIKPIINFGIEVDSCYLIENSCWTNREDILKNLQLLPEERRFRRTWGYYEACPFTTPLAEAIRLKETSTETCKLIGQKASFSRINKTVVAFAANVYAATETGNYAMVQELIKMAMKGELFPLNKSTKYESSSILDACSAQAIYQNRKDIQQLLFSFGSEMDGEGYAARKTLLAALKQRDIDFLRRLPSLRPLAENYCDHDGDEELPISLKILAEILNWGDKSVVEALVKRGLHLDEHPIADRFIWREVMEHHGDNLGFVDFLLGLGAPLHPLKASSALYEAISNKRPGMVNHLLNAGADPGESKALECAVKYSKDSVSQLLEAFSQQHPLGKRNYGVAALCFTVTEGDLGESIKISRFVDVNGSVKDFHGRNCQVRGEQWSPHEDRYVPARLWTATPLEVAIIADQDHKLDLMAILLRAGADPNRILSRKVWPLHCGKRLCVPETAILTAIRAGAAIEVIQLLVSYGAEINREATQSLNRTSLQYASEFGRKEIVEWLIKNGAEVNANPATCNGGTALQLASKNGWLDIVKILIEAEADVNGPTSEVRGETALQSAAANGYIGIAEILLSNGADIDAPGSKPFCMTALQIAAQNGRMLMVELLLKHHPSVKQIPLAIEYAEMQQHGPIVKRLQKFQQTALFLNQTLVFDYGVLR